jgi:hypothetical protein
MTHRMLSDISGRGVVLLGDFAVPDDAVASLRGFAEKYFAGCAAHLLVKDVTRSLRWLLVVANRRQAPYNVVLRIDLESELTAEQRAAIERFREEFRTRPGVRRLLAFGTRNVQFHNLSAGPADVAMAFINTWPIGPSHEEAHRYWVEHHGPLVQKVGLPSVITSYSQIHFDDSFDQDYQGLSFETITSQRDLVRCYLRDAAMRKLNKILLADEKHFTGPPLFFAFRSS